MLRIENLNAGYPQKTVLHEINLEVARGSVVALIGPNGSGKTTLVRALSGVLPSLSGLIRLDGKDLNKLGAQERARLIAVVPQVRTLPPAFTVQEVVALGRTPYLNWFGQTSGHDQQIIRTAMEQVDLLELADRNIAELSGGEQQRVLLARALAQQTSVLLLDEPTSHLDLQYQVSFLEKVRQLAHPSPEQISSGFEKRAVLVAIHDLNLLNRYADQVALLDKGRLLIVGHPEEVLQPHILSQAYHLPLGTLQDPESGSLIVYPR